MEGKKLRICLRGPHLKLSVLLRTRSATTLKFTPFGSGPEAKPSRASAFWFFLSTTMVLVAVRTHFPKKNTRVYRNTVTCVTRVTRSTSLEFVAFGNGSDIKLGRASTFRYFLSATMVFAVVRTHFPKKNTRVYGVFLRVPEHIVLLLYVRHCNLVLFWS